MNIFKVIIIGLISIVFIAAGFYFFSGSKKEIIVSKSDMGEIEFDEDVKKDELKDTEEKKATEESVTSSVSEEAPQEIPAESKEEKTEEVEVVDFKIRERPAGWGFQTENSRKIDTIVIHSSYNALSGDLYDLDKILNIYKNYGVSPHYIITREGKIYRLVADKNIAWHAGVSQTPDGRKNVNEFSIGIEMINSKTVGPSEAQYKNLKKLINYIKDNYNIKYVLGHSDIAPGRKDDPWKFDWKKIK